MKFRVLLFIIVCSCLSPRNGYPSSPQEIIKIAPYGNSITQAASDHQSYRYPLWKKLIDAEIPFDFVGSMDENFGGNPSRPDYNGMSFDLDHEGHWGWRADEIYNSMNSWLSQYTPDMVLLHIGTNDCIQGQDNNTTRNEITLIVGKLRNDNPEVVIFMANLIPCNESSNTSLLVKELNGIIELLAEDLNTDSSPIIFVDQNSGINAGSDLYDGIHPGPTGEEKMAQKWFDAINGYLTSTQTKKDFAMHTPPRFARTTARRIELIGLYRQPKRDALLYTNGLIINLLGKKVSPSIEEGTITNGVYIISDFR